MSLFLVLTMAVTAARTIWIFNLMTWNTRYTAILMFFFIGLGSFCWLVRLLLTDESPDIDTMMILSGLCLWSLFDRGHVSKCLMWKDRGFW